ncbi:lipase maturation factor 2-like [Anthonomus grandis grandis]|uniref:lipase maturation factor 2-like n=1 Tax=Anthonomus grandis grandis TaxID=2921223 RepID=UPI0021654F33|nr:lipase maturation factor 2-like [Anthonomus grandis grandis]
MDILSVRYTRNLLLRALCVVYLSAFLSFYYQIPGLFGENGILPARSLLENSKHKTLFAKIHYQPTLLWVVPYLGLTTTAGMELLALLGVFLSFSGIISQKFCIVPIFTALWSLYFSLFQVGQVFTSNNYDEFLLEAGFLAIFMSPLFPNRRRTKTSTLDSITFWMCRWLLFRILFSAALGKLLSGCPKWWTLTALDHHFETMPLPNPFSWYAHHLPAWVLRLSTVYTNVCELIVPFTFFLPIRAARITAFLLEAFLQLCILATGNYGHANMLVLTLLLTLLDDNIFYKRKRISSKMEILDKTLNIGLWAGIVFGVVKLYGLVYKGGILDAHITFSKSQFNSLVENHLHHVIALAIISLGVTVIVSLWQILFNKSYNGKRVTGLIGAIFYTAVAFFLLVSSSTALLSMHPKTNSTVNAALRTTFNRLHKAHIVNHYNLFPVMPGSEGRPEIVLEGAKSLDGPWSEYNFLYKPGNVNNSLTFVAPYSPRIDWQLYWAARSSYDKQPWLLSLTYHLLTGNTQILNLIDRQNLPFANQPPKYIRGILYKYKFTTWSQRSKSAWWIRERVSEYFPAFSKDSPALEDFLKARNLLPTRKSISATSVMDKGLEGLRSVVNRVDASMLFWSILLAAFAILTSGSLF